MAVNLSIEIKNDGLEKVYRETGKAGTLEITIVAYDTVNSWSSDGILMKFNPANLGELTLNSPVSIPIAEGKIIDTLRLYERVAGMGDDMLSIIDLEDLEDKPKEIGNFTDKAGTYQINSLYISFPA